MIGVGIGLGQTALRTQPAQGGGPVAVDPITALYAGGIQGAHYDPADLATLSQDAGGTQPVTADGQPVGRMCDLSGNGNHATNANAASRPLYRTDGVRHWLEFRGTDYLAFDNAVYGTTAPLTMLGAMALTGNGNYPVLFGGNSTGTGLFFGVGQTGAPRIRLNVIGGAGGTGPLLYADAGETFALNEPYVVGHVIDAPEVAGWIGGRRVMTGSRTGGWALPAEGRIGFTASPITSPVLFYGGIIVRRSLDAGQMTAAGSHLAARSGAAYLASGPGSALAATRVYAVGDSTVAAYNSHPGISSLMTTARTRIDVAVPGHTIAQQKTAWQAQTIEAGKVGWVVIQIGLNDMNPALGTTASKIAALQDLVDTIRASIDTAPLFVAQMLPARLRWNTLYGASGPAAHQRWIDVNAAVAGQGPTAITNVDGRIVAHVPQMDDGSGALKALYYTGDHIHPNAAGRQVMADAWAAALLAGGLTV